MMAMMTMVMRPKVIIDVSGNLTDPSFFTLQPNFFATFGRKIFTADD